MIPTTSAILKLPLAGIPFRFQGATSPAAVSWPPAVVCSLCGPGESKCHGGTMFNTFPRRRWNNHREFLFGTTMCPFESNCFQCNVHLQIQTVIKLHQHKYATPTCIYTGIYNYNIHIFIYYSFVYAHLHTHMHTSTYAHSWLNCYTHTPFAIFTPWTRVFVCWCLLYPCSQKTLRLLKPMTNCFLTAWVYGNLSSILFSFLWIHSLRTKMVAGL